MVSKAYLALAAMNAYRIKGTAIARAMLKALGIDVPPRMPAYGSVVSCDSYTEIEECFANHGSPMDAHIGGLL